MSEKKAKQRRSSGADPKCYNDVSWYLSNPELVKSAGSFWYSDPAGKAIDPYSANKDGTIPSTQTKLRISPQKTRGIMSIDFIPTFGVTGNVEGSGYADYNNSALNVSASQLFWDVVHANSRNISYDKNDLFMFLMAMDAIYCMLSDAVRAYALLGYYSMGNKYIGRNLTIASGWFYDELIKDIPRVRYTINRLIQKVNSIHVPRVFNIFNAHNSNFSKVFMDAEGDKSQFYILRMPGYYLFDDINGKLDFKYYYNNYGKRIANINTEVLKSWQYFDIIDACIDKIYNSTDMGVIDGDLLKRFGDADMYKFPEIEERVELEFGVDDEFFAKLENATFAGIDFANVTNAFSSDSVRWAENYDALDETFKWYELDFYEGENAYRLHPTYIVGKNSESVSEIEVQSFMPYKIRYSTGLASTCINTAMLAAKTVLSRSKEFEGSPEENMIMTRWITASKLLSGFEVGKYATVDIAACGTEILLDARVIALEGKEYTEVYVGPGVLRSATPGFNLLDVQEGLSQFRYKPTMYCSGSNLELRRIRDLDKFVLIGIDDIARMHYCAISSVFARVDSSQYGFAR